VKGSEGTRPGLQVTRHWEPALREQSVLTAPWLGLGGLEQVRTVQEKDKRLMATGAWPLGWTMRKSN
jgi:hypothetical protein